MARPTSTRVGRSTLFAIGNAVTTPGDAYKYFKGEPIKHPMGFEVKIDTPLDWAGVTDHSEYAGVVQLANEPGSPVSKVPAAKPLILKAKTKEEMMRVALYAINTLVAGPPVKALMAPEIAGAVWNRNVELAEQANQPGKFTAFCSYEWTSMPHNMNLHRNVFFKDCAKVPVTPYSALDSFHPVDLWNWMDAQRSGWKYAADVMSDKDWPKTGYAKGVPMGGDLPPASAGTKAPTFIVWAVKDPTSGNLDRIQIVKGWAKDGQSFEKTFDVVWPGDRKPDKWTGVVPPIGGTVNIEEATYANTIGAVELRTVWTDPEFDPSLHAFYYARVLEIPTPRWTTIQAKKLGIAPPDTVAATIQERAWGSPIWYTPSAEARKSAKPGMTVADLKQGAVALNDAHLKALIEEKSVWMQNNVTGDKYMVEYGALGKGGVAAKPLTPSEPGYVTQRYPVNQGQFQVRYVGKKVAMQSLTGDAVGASYLGTSRTYNIQNGKLVIDLVGTPIEVSVYKVGDKYLAARSNEFGYANYEMIPAVAELSPLR